MTKRSGEDEAQTAPLAVADPDEIVRRELSAIMPVIAATLMAQSGATFCSFFVYDPEVTRTVVSFRHGDAPVVYSSMEEVESLSPSDVPIEAEILRTRRTIRRSTEADFERWPFLNESLRTMTERYVDIVVPLRRHDRVNGVVYLGRDGDWGPYTDAEVANAERLAEIAAMAVEYARHYGKERFGRISLNGLLNVASLAASHLTIDQVMPEVARIVRGVTDADVCNLYVFDDSGQSVEAAYSDGLNERERWVFDVSHTYPVSVVPAEERARETHTPYLVRHPETELAPDSELIIYAREERLSEILVVPIVYQMEMIGVIYLWYREPARRFHAQAISTAQGIANQAGGVIAQARMYDESRRHIAETEALRRIGETVLNNYSLDSVLDEIAGVLAKMITFDYVFVGTLSDDGEAVRIRRTWGKFSPDVTGFRISMDHSLTGSVIRSGSLLNLPSADQDSRAQRYEPEHRSIRSVMISPLRTENGIVGVLYTARRDPAGYTQRQERLMTMLCQQAAAAIERTESREALANHAQRQTFLAAVTNRLISAVDPVDALQEIADQACGVLADGVLVGLSSWKYGEIRWAGAAHREPERDSVLRNVLEGGDIALDPEHVEGALAADEALHTILWHGSPVEDQAFNHSVIDLLGKLEPSEVLTLPMRRHGRAPGLLILLSADPDRILCRDVREMAQLVANRIGDALERRRMAQNREALLRVSRMINMHADLNDLLKMITEELYKIVPYDEMNFARLDPETNTLRPLAFLSPLGLPLNDLEISAHSGISGEVIQLRRALFDNNAHLRPTSTYFSKEEAAFFEQHGESAMAAPLIADDTVIGVLFISRHGTNRFSDSDFETFLLFAGLAASAMHRTELLQTNQSMFRASVEVLAAVVDARDPTAHQHSRNVAKFAQMLAKQIGLDDLEIEQIELAGLLHDIGKLSIPDHILSKPGPLTDWERTLINMHPDRGARILSQHPSLTSLIPLVRHQHEWINGEGYPDGLRGDRIPLGASILSIADAFDTMTSYRTYQQRMNVEDALDELVRCAGTQFHPDLVKLFVSAIRSQPDVPIIVRNYDSENVRDELPHVSRGAAPAPGERTGVQ